MVRCSARALVNSSRGRFGPESRTLLASPHSGTNEDERFLQEIGLGPLPRCRRPSHFRLSFRPQPLPTWSSHWSGWARRRWTSARRGTRGRGCPRRRSAGCRAGLRLGATRIGGLRRRASTQRAGRAGRRSRELASGAGRGVGQTLVSALSVDVLRVPAGLVHAVGSAWESGDPIEGLSALFWKPGAAQVDAVVASAVDGDFKGAAEAGVVGEVGPQACEIIGLKSSNSPTTDEGAGAGRGRVFQCCTPVQFGAQRGALLFAVNRRRNRGATAQPRVEPRALSRPARRGRAGEAQRLQCAAAEVP